MNKSIECGIRFLLQEDDRPFLSSRCFIVADPTSREHDQWDLLLSPPAEGGWVFEIDDVKSWMLQGGPERKMFYDRHDTGTPYRILNPNTVFRAYVARLFAQIPQEYRHLSRYALMPSISEPKSRRRYKEALEAAIPDVAVLPEPEMVAEYFRLVTRTLELESDVNNVVLIVDTGASTANMTIVLSRRDGQIVESGGKGAQRMQRLRTMRGDSVANAGRWVDEQLANLVGASPTDPALMRKIESAKISVSRGTVQQIEVALTEGGAPGTIDRAKLGMVTVHLWHELRPAFERLFEQLYASQISTSDAREKSADRLKDKKVNGPRDAHRLIDMIVLAGGTSLLPDFEEAMLASIFPDGYRPKVIKVGDTFPIAAAVGGIAHVLNNDILLRRDGKNDASLSSGDVRLETTLQCPIVMAIKTAQTYEEKIVILSPDDPFVDTGGTRLISGLPSFQKGEKAKARLLLDDKNPPRGRRPKEFSVARIPVEMSLTWVPDSSRATVSSHDTVGLDLWISAEKTEVKTASQEQSGHILLDLGMSKIVAVFAGPGGVSQQYVKDALRGTEMAERASTVSTESAIDLQSEQELPRATQDSVQFVSSTNKADQSDESRALPSVTFPDVERETHSPVNSQAHPRPSEIKTSGWDTRSSGSEFVQVLTQIGKVFREQEHSTTFADIVVALIGLAVRPTVILAGPPGCGKSTLVRLIARLLGKTPDDSFHDIAVQAHWTNDDALFGDKGNLLKLLQNDNRGHLVLFDEFNLTRPEYYLSRLFHAIESDTREISDGCSIASCRVMGTLNIDESSRVPSPKIIDRCFLIELPQVLWDGDASASLPTLGEEYIISGLPEVPRVTGNIDERVKSVVTALRKAVDENGLRHDFLPSRRVLADIKAVLSLHESLGLNSAGLLETDDVVDRLIASRILVKLSGAFETVEPALDAVEKALRDSNSLPMTHRRLKLARRQEHLGFVSPWH
ncbi:AAA family ATPase [Acetobacter fabarum]|uniref:AAA family ATPase n=1 Tax=Acetobacter fabarum TaxID=483199 RepID=UPI0039E7E19B